MAGLIAGAGFPQTIKSNLNGKRIYMQRNDGGHEEGYLGMRDLLEANKNIYGYTFEYSPQALSFPQLDSLYNRLYKAGGARAANTIDILIFCEGEGDGNFGRVNMDNPADAIPMYARQKNVNTHLRMGGAMLMVHAAAGREVSWYRWGFGAKLVSDWFLDGTNASVQVPGNSGHFSAGTLGTATLDEETLPTRDSSTYFVRKLFTSPKASSGYGQPLTNMEVKGEWYHFNGAQRYEDGTGGLVTNPRNSYQQQLVRGNPGVPDSGIGPAKVFAVLTKIGANYTPPGKGRNIIWGREVSKGVFDPRSSATNGRYMYYQPGHDRYEWTQAGGWMGDLFLAGLRWVVRDDRGCMIAGASSYNPVATVNDCGVTGIRFAAEPGRKADPGFGKLKVGRSFLGVKGERNPSSAGKAVNINGQQVME